MKKFFSTLCLVFISYIAQAQDMKEGHYIPSNPKVVQMVQSDELNAFTYQLLRHTEAELKKDRKYEGKDFHTDVSRIWLDSKNQIVSKHDKVELLKKLINVNARFLTLGQLEMAFTLGLKERTIWDKSTARFGPTITHILQGLTFVTIVSSLVITPVAAAVVPMLQGSFRDSCDVVKEQKFSSNDPNVKGNFVYVEAQCRYDRADHGVKTNTIVVPEGGPCGYLHNNNGTLVGTDTYAFVSGLAHTSGSGACPDLVGSFLKTCGKVTSQTYKSSDSRIPLGSICQYDVQNCKKIGQNWGPGNTLRIPSAEVQCRGSRIENCDGDLVVRQSGQSDSQCDTAQGYKKKNEL
jgi:hypothetical protein